MTTEDFKKIYDTIPLLPGVYRFLDENKTILYVGKAKNLRNRLSNYFGEKKQQYYKTKVMVRNAVEIEFTIVDSEHDALLLENTYIKKYQPKYNIMLKDGKSYSYICIKNEAFPRVFFTRKVWRDGSTYFGPYTSKGKVKVILDLIKKLFPLRTCKYQLTDDNIRNGKFKVCLEYHIKNCKGACEGLEELQSYNTKIDQIKNILKGNFGQVKEYITTNMLLAAENLAFEEAQNWKEKLELFEDYHAKSTVVSATIKDLDVFTLRMTDKAAFINYLKIVNGALIYTDMIEVERNIEEEEDIETSILAYVIPEVQKKYHSIATEIISSHEFVLPSGIQVSTPQRGEKRKLLELSVKNLDYFLAQKKKMDAEAPEKPKSSQRILSTLQADLHMNELPYHIECFDNSNIQGTNPVASCVVFKDAKPSKKDYRHFKIKTVVGPNDFASMEEIVYRRYKRLLEEGEALPQLVIIDGGKGQLSSAVASLDKLGITGKLTVIGVAKRLEEIFFPGDSIPLYINKKSESLKLIQHCRNEAHRFAISFHRDLRSKNFITTELTEIKGIGAKSAEKLLQKFQSVTNIRSRSLTELAEEIGMSAATKVKAYFDGQSEHT